MDRYLSKKSSQQVNKNEYYTNKMNNRARY